MAFLASSSIKPACNYSLKPDSFNRVKHEPSLFGRTIITNPTSRKFSNRGLIISNIATKPAPSKQEHEENEEKKNTAWTSVKQEQWQGELHVQGQIPLWLVIIIIFYLISFSFPTINYSNTIQSEFTRKHY